VTTPDLMGELAAAVRVTKKELNALDDLAEQVQTAAAKVLACPSSAALAADLQASCDRLLSWQLSSKRHEAIALRARAIGAYRELEEAPA
jgi:hypothetical protein